MHNFYNGIERLLERIAREIDNHVPQRANLHQQLLEQMSLEIDHKRPAVISFNTRKILEDYRGLRHVVRNIYAFEFESEKLHPLVDNSPFILSQIILECQAFATFIEQYK
ncbi:hypothetical protein [Aphanothece sacrum]|uniref:Recombination protein RecJ n=1 Tax=Aphanothece sacrum FPU1 TaxID=1920663 RepID=A0A401IDR9_APHSA|nr:hypothetical protein [Aphanothece sacrum]GBF79364.1 recombination protein RecJ [Aphanothece sacrum FPU1]GBF86865.1 recombination protein RecJ [Aphanothece sacrum FPU3]